MLGWPSFLSITKALTMYIPSNGVTETPGIVGQSHIIMISRSEIIWEDHEILDVSLSNSSCSHRVPKSRRLKPYHIHRIDVYVNLTFVNGKKRLLLTCHSTMVTRIIFAELDTSLSGLLGSVLKCWLSESNQSITRCLSCHWSMDPVSGLIAWLPASLPL